MTRTGSLSRVADSDRQSLLNQHIHVRVYCNTSMHTCWPMHFFENTAVLKNISKLFSEAVGLTVTASVQSINITVNHCYNKCIKISIAKLL